jgi:hypothetical protein
MSLGREVLVSFATYVDDTNCVAFSVEHLVPVGRGGKGGSKKRFSVGLAKGSRSIFCSAADAALARGIGGGVVRRGSMQEWDP